MSMTRRAARRRCLIAAALTVASVIGGLLLWSLWASTTVPAFALASNAALTASFGVVGVRAWRIATRGDHTPASASVDRWIAALSAIVAWAVTTSAMLALETPAWPTLLAYAVGMSSVLFTLSIRNWKAPSLSGELEAHQPFFTPQPRP